MSAEDEVRQASDQFYAAINRLVGGAAGTMDDVWAHSSDVTAMHPLGGRQVGWDQVRASWEQVAQLASGGQLRLQDPLLHVVGDLAYEMGTESGQATLAGESVAFSQRVTNIYRREGGTWELVHHHTDVSPVMAEMVTRLQAGSTA